jgi:ABC-2 type transport system ATP-binding protein
MTGTTLAWGVHDLTVRYGGTIALEGIDLEVRPGEVVAVIGGDGAGKTTLLRTLVGTVHPATGTVRAPARAHLGFMPSTAGTWAELTVDENLDFAADAYQVHGAQLETRRAELMAGTGLGPARRRTAARLSGGMRQKLAFAMATVHRPELLVLDEPTTGVDPVSRVELWRMISAAAAAGTAVVMSTTYLGEAERAARVLVLADGRPLLSGPPSQVAASAPGTVVQPATGLPAEHTWGRGHTRHGWLPVDQPVPPGCTAIAPDLEDAVIAATLARLDLAAQVSHG